MKLQSLRNLQPAALTLASALVLSCTAFTPAPLAAQQQPAQPSQPSGQRSDGQIEMDVVQALDESQALKDDLITAATIQGKVTLSGTVSADANKQLAQSIVAKVPGVGGVVNNLKVGNPADAANADNLPAPEDDDQAAAQQSGQQPGYPQQGSAQPGYPSDPNYPQPGDQPNPQQAPPPNGYPQQPNGYPQQQQPGYPQQPNGYPQQGSSQPGYPPPPPTSGRPAYPGPGNGPGYGPGYPPLPPQGGYGQQGYGQGPYGGQQQPYQPAPSFAIPTGPVTLNPGTVLQLRTTNNVDSKRATPGTPIDFTVIRDVSVNGFLAIPLGATIHGVVTDVQHSGQLAGSAELGLRLVSLDLGGKNYPLNSDVFRVKSPNKAGRTVGNAIGGALLGALIGGAAGGGSGAAIGAGAGATVGTAASAATPNPRAWIPAEALVRFQLTAPITVDPVSKDEAARLAQGMYQGGPQLYRRPGPGYYAYPAPYGYPPVYYRPYYMVGGGYYWR